jgi:glycosyltransferase involved in cell wall biosynthesis
MTRGWIQPTVEEWRQGIPIWHVPFAPAYPFHVQLHAPFINALLRDKAGDFDLVHAHTPLSPPIRSSLPLVVTVHSPMAADTSASRVHDWRSLLLHLQTPISKRVERALFERSCRITAVASWVADALRGYGVPTGSVAITGNGVEQCFLEGEPADLTGGYVLFVGRLEEGKGLFELTTAASLVAESQWGAQVRYVLVGEGPLRAALQARLAAAGLADRFTFTGQINSAERSKLHSIYRHAQVFVLPSHHEGMPTVLLEAMACGLPVVACAVGGCCEVIRDGENGLLVPPQQPEALARAILLLLEGEERRRALALRARATVQTGYSWESVVERYCACYAQALAGASRG